MSPSSVAGFASLTPLSPPPVPLGTPHPPPDDASPMPRANAAGTEGGGEERMRQTEEGERERMRQTDRTEETRKREMGERKWKVCERERKKRGISKDVKREEERELGEKIEERRKWGRKQRKRGRVSQRGGRRMRKGKRRKERRARTKGGGRGKSEGGRTEGTRGPVAARGWAAREHLSRWGGGG